jgi:hypothetical protein
VRIYCPYCQAVRDAAFKCIGFAGRAVCAYAICTTVLLADHPHTLDPHPSGATPYRAVMVSTIAVSTGTILPSTAS